MGHFAFKNLHIQATDIDESGQFGQVIQTGIYPHEQLDRIPRPIFEKYFTPSGPDGQFQIAAAIRDCVAYRQHD